MADFSDLLPSPEALRDNLWSWLVIAAPGFLLWAFSQAKRWPFLLRVIAFAAAEAAFVYLGVLASTRYGAAGSVGGMLLVALPFVPLLRRGERTPSPSAVTAAAPSPAPPSLSVASEAAAVPRPKVTEENTERLRQARGPCQRAVSAVIEQIRNEVSGKAIAEDDHRGNLIVRLLMDFPVNTASARSGEVGIAIESIAGERQITDERFTEIRTLYEELLGSYHTLCEWYLTASRVIIGQAEQFRSAGYKDLTEKNAQLVARLDSLEGFSLFKSLHWHAGALREKLPAHRGFSVADLPDHLRPSKAIALALGATRYTTEGLSWWPVPGGGHARSDGSFIRIIEIAPIPAGSEFPLPLSLRFVCPKVITGLQVGLGCHDVGELPQAQIELPELPAENPVAVVRYPRIKTPLFLRAFLHAADGEFQVVDVQRAIGE